MSAPDTSTGSEPRGILTRGPELGMALFLLLLSVLVITDSLRVGTDWADDGPKAGYFPFFIGIGLAGASLAIAIGQLRRWAGSREVFVQHSQLADVWAVLWPMVLYTALIKPLGIYLASLVLIAYFMRRHGQFSWLVCAGTGLGVVGVLFAVFERWFSVPLPKGPIEAWLGF